jgi:hypothetical protein
MGPSRWPPLPVGDPEPVARAVLQVVLHDTRAANGGTAAIRRPSRPDQDVLVVSLDAAGLPDLRGLFRAGHVCHGLLGGGGFSVTLTFVTIR